MTPVIFGALRVRNEERWIRRVIEAIQPVCAHVFILSDFSEDATPDICESLGCTVFRDAVPWVEVNGEMVSDESAGKEFLLERLYEAIPEQHQHFTRGNPESPYWTVLLDGDEELFEEDQQQVYAAAHAPGVHAFKFRIPYLWNDENTVRIDGVYRYMADRGRPSMFRLMNSAFRFQRTPFGRSKDSGEKKSANFHCSSVPQEMLHHAHDTGIRLKHWGYMYPEDRIRKYHWYNRRDENNLVEDGYRHMVIGDLFPADSKFRHAGPLELVPLSSIR